ncbi:MAG: PhzF family phenazine biosynthesis protein [Saprospiraceae bacterium]
MTQKIYQVDAFTDKVFAGNPAAVCPLNRWLEDDLMQKIAAENNLSETVFYVKNGDNFDIRWFTPEVEVDLCGHATLAAAFVLFFHEGFSGDTIHFHSERSGPLSVKKNDDLLTLNFPIDEIHQMEMTSDITLGFNISPVAAYKGKTDYMLIYDQEDQIRHLIPDYNTIKHWPVRGVIVTAAGKHSDFVSRFFAPQSGVNEDPVTGSAHTSLTPYWSAKLNKNEMTAIQLSSRGGYLKCIYLHDRVEISGTAKLFLKGEIFIL